MATKQRLTKAQVLAKLINELILALNPVNNIGLIDLSLVPLDRIQKNAKDCISEAPSYYYQLLGLIEAYKANYSQSDKYFKNAIQLNKSDLDIQLNHLNIRLILGHTKEVKDWILKNYPINEIDIYALHKLFLVSMFDLDFTDFNRYYYASKSSLVMGDAIKNLFEGSHYFDTLLKDLEKINVNKQDFKDVLLFVYHFYSIHTHAYFEPIFRIDDKYTHSLIVNIYMNVDIETAIDLTSDFEDAFVNFAIEKNRNNYLSQFSVFFKPISCIDEDCGEAESNFEEMV